MTRTKPNRKPILITGALLVTALLFFSPTLAKQTDEADNDRNPGTIKIHEAGEIGDPNNDPHVGCPFYVEGFNMEASSGTITIKSWPPTGNKSVVHTESWTATDPANTTGHHFLSSAITLPDGHYKVYVTNANHPKMKVFWVECGPVEIPVFPSGLSLMAGTLGALGTAFVVLRRK